MHPPLPDAPCKERHLHPYSASVPGYRESSIAQFSIQITPSADFLYSRISNSCLTQLVAPISALVSELGRTAALIYFLLCLIRHIDQSKPIEHTIYMSHPGCHPELLTDQPPRRSLLHWPAALRFTPDFCCFLCGRSIIPLCIAHSDPFVFQE